MRAHYWFVLLLAAYCHAQTIRVPQDVPTLEEALTSQGIIENILIAPGTYTLTEVAVWSGTRIEGDIGTYGSPADVILNTQTEISVSYGSFKNLTIQGNGQNSRLINVNSNAYTTFDNCHFQNALRGISNSGSSNNGYNSAVQLYGCVFSGISLAAIELQSIQVNISQSTILNCGTGIEVSNCSGSLSESIIENCNIGINHQTTLSWSEYQVWKSSIRSCRSSAIMSGGRLVISRSIFDANGSEGNVITSSGSVNLANCTIVNNHSDQTGSEHGLLESVGTSWDSNVSMSYCILWGNDLSEGNHLIYAAATETPEDYRVYTRNNCIQDSAFCNLQSVEEGLVAHGNILDDPLLTEDFRLSAGSPCIDAIPWDDWEHDLDNTPLDLGALFHCQGLGITGPMSLGFTIEPGGSSYKHGSLQNSCELVLIDSIRSTAPEFSVYHFSDRIENQYSQAGVTVQFATGNTGLFSGNLEIHYRTDQDDYQDSHVYWIQLVGESGPQPTPVSDLTVQLLPDNSVHLDWSPVTTSIYGHPITPDYYLIYFSERFPWEDNFYFHSAVTETEFTHFLAANYSDWQFYKVTAWRGTDPASLDVKQGDSAATVRQKLAASAVSER